MTHQLKNAAIDVSLISLIFYLFNALIKATNCEQWTEITVKENVFKKKKMGTQVIFLLKVFGLAFTSFMFPSQGSATRWDADLI